jgi:hypothetical protein
MLVAQVIMRSFRAASRSCNPALIASGSDFECPQIQITGAPSVSDKEMPSLASAIHDHLELKRRNAALEFEMPLADYLRRDTSNYGEGAGTNAELEEEDTLAGVIWPE